jgi:hypothetical protein
VENSSLLEVPPDLAGYDVLHQNPVRGLFCGPAVVRTWPAREPRLIDTDVCEPMQVTESAEGITSQLMVPASLASSRPRALTFYWPGTSVEVRVDGRTAAATALGAGFYRIDAPSPGMHEFAVRPAGATTKGKA